MFVVDKNAPHFLLQIVRLLNDEKKKADVKACQTWVTLLNEQDALQCLVNSSSITFQASDLSSPHFQTILTKESRKRKL